MNSKRLLLVTGLLLSCALTVQKAWAAGEKPEKTGKVNKIVTRKMASSRHAENMSKRGQSQQAGTQATTDRNFDNFSFSKDHNTQMQYGNIQMHPATMEDSDRMRNMHDFRGHRGFDWQTEWHMPRQGKMDVRFSSDRDADGMGHRGHKDQGPMSKNFAKPDPALRNAQEAYFKSNPNEELQACCRDYPWSETTLAALMAAPALMATLEKMNLVWDHNFAAFCKGDMSKFTNLKNVTIKHGIITSDDALALQKLAGLKELTLTNCNVGGLMTNLPAGLTKLVLDKCTNVTWPTTLPAGLTLVAIEGDKTLTSIPTCITALPNLQFLALRGTAVAKQTVTNASGKNVMLFCGMGDHDGDDNDRDHKQNRGNRDRENQDRS